MDREKEQLEESKQKTNLDTLLTPTAATNLILSTSSTTPTDDDASTESSDCLESWTLVNDKDKNIKLRNQLEEDNVERVEILKNEEEEEEVEEEEVEEAKEEEKFKEHQLKDSLTDPNNDDFSDGISIISESESVGRVSPHPYLRDHLHDLNLKFTLGEHMDDSIINKLREEMDHDTATFVVQQPAEPVVQQQIRQRRRSSTAERENQALQKASQTVAVSSGFSPLVKRGLQGIFYVGVGLAILALIGKIVHPTWQPLNKAGSSTDTSGELEQKVNDMELQNNLMRAEIDLLNKQVKYLSNLKDPQQQYQQKQGKFKDYKEGKTFKAWAGNGDSLKPVEISKQDLRKPYKCPDGSFVEIANMCMEQSNSKEPNIVEQFGQVVEDLKEQSEAFKTFEEVAEQLQGFQDNPFEQLQEIFTEERTPEAVKKDFIKNKPIYETPQDYKQQNLPDKEKYQKYPNPKEDTYSSKPYKTNKYDDNSKPQKDFKKSFNKDEMKSNKEFKKYHPHNPYNSQDHSKDTKEWHKDQFNNNNNSKERKNRRDKSKDFDDDSQENSRENHSKERFNKQKRKYDKSRENNGDDDSGEWQEKYMKHREQLRKQNEQKYQENNKNWYIKRGDSREHKRSGEKQYR